MLKYVDPQKKLGAGQEIEDTANEKIRVKDPVPQPKQGTGQLLSPVGGAEPAILPEDEEGRAVVLEQKIETLERRIGYLERIVKVSQILNSTLSLEPLLQIIIQAATELTNTEACSIMLLDKDTNELHFAEATGGASDALKKVVVPLESSIGGWVVRGNRPLLIRDAKNDPRWHGGVDKTIDFETHSILGVPLKVRGKVTGVMELLNKKTEDGFSQDDIQIATTLSAHASIAIENARLMDELQQAYRDLSEVDRIKGDFVSIASHELRTPLAVILGYASFLRDTATGQASEQLDIVFNSALRLRSLIDDMINLRHIRAGEVHLERAIFSLRQLTLDVMGEFSDLIKGKEQAMTVKFTPDNSKMNIDADQQKVYLILANLISNATKFTGDGGRIHITIELKEYQYHINVIDTGIGIPKKEFNNIFNQFYQVESVITRKYQGMGLGLSITKGMVEVHKGQIMVESVVRKGSNFTVILPSALDVA